MNLNNDKIKNKFSYFNLEKLADKYKFLTLGYYLDFENQSYNYMQEYSCLILAIKIYVNEEIKD